MNSSDSSSNGPNSSHTNGSRFDEVTEKNTKRSKTTENHSPNSEATPPLDGHLVMHRSHELNEKENMENESSQAIQTGHKVGASFD